MPKLTWDAVGERLYETGTSKGALFVQGTDGNYGTGVAWNGLTGVTQSPDGAEESPLYADDIKYLSLYSMEEFNGTVEAYTYPDEFAICDGSHELAPGVYVGQQQRRPFGLVYTTVVGNDTQGNAYGQKIHIIYGARVTPSDRSYETINNDPDAITFSWEFTTTPQSVSSEDIKPTSYLSVDSTKVDADVFATIRDMVYGSAEDEPTLPSIDEVIDLLAPGA